MARRVSNGIPLENITHGFPVINTDHENIHKGEGFTASVGTESVADDGFVYIEFRTAATKYVHLKSYRAWSEGGVATLEIIEAPTLTTGSTAITPANRRRGGTPPASVSVLKSDPTSISAGTVIEGPIFFGGGGSGSGVAGNSSFDEEIVLKQSAVYLIRVKNLAGSVKALGLRLFWYEESGG